MHQKQKTTEHTRHQYQGNAQSLDVVDLTYVHNRALVDLAQQLVVKTEADFMPERRLQAERRVGQGRKQCLPKSHMSDGLLYIGDDKRVTIELEISLKERNPMSLTSSLNEQALLRVTSWT